MKVLLVGHAVGPGRGSEPGNTWNFAARLSESHQVTLISHPERREDVEAELARHPRPNLRIIWVTPPPRIDPWDPRKGDKGLRLHYMLWQRYALKMALRLCETEQFDVAHHFSWGTVNAPPLLHKLPIPVVWGPIGGGQTSAPEVFSSHGCDTRPVNKGERMYEGK